MVDLKLGEKIPLMLLTENRATDRVVRARIYDAVAVEIAGSPVNVAHLADGTYFDNSLAMPDTDHITVEYDVFDGPGFTNVSVDLLPDNERFDRDRLQEVVKMENKATDLVGVVEPDIILEGVIESDDLIGIIEDEDLAGAVAGDSELVAESEEGDLTGTVEC